MFQGKRYFLSLLSFIFLNKQEDITSLSQHFIIIQSDQDLCPLTKLMHTIEYINGQEQSREDPDKTVRMHRFILTFAIRMQ